MGNDRQREVVIAKITDRKPMIYEERKLKIVKFYPLRHSL